MSREKDWSQIAGLCGDWCSRDRMSSESAHSDGGTSGESFSEQSPYDEAWNGRRRFVTVQEKGNLRVNRGAAQAFFTDAEAITLHKKEGSDVVALRPLDEYDEEADSHHEVPEENEPIQISAKSFLQHYDLLHDETTRYTPTKNEEYGVIEVDLSEDGEVPNSVENSDDSE
jgi:hypothetical protein